MNYRVKEYEELSLKDLLAIDRTKLANSRTFLAYLRTAIMMIVSAITILKLLPHFLIMRIIGYILIPLSIIIFIFGLVQYIRFSHKITFEADQFEEVPDFPKE